MNGTTSNRKLWLAAACVALAAPTAAAADYLDAAFRADCLAETDVYYSAADPVIGTVPQVKSEIGRIASNFLVYTGFKWSGSGEDFRGHVYGIRLFYEQTENGNDWKFTRTGVPDLLETCGEEDSACLFDAGAVLQERTEARRILVGKPAADVPAPSNGAYTVPMDGAVEVDASGGVSALRAVWQRYTALGPIREAMPEWNGSSWNCGHLPAAVPATLCPTSTGCNKLSGALKDLCLVLVGQKEDAPNLGNPSDDQLAALGRWLHGEDRPWKLGDVYHASATVVEPPGFDYRDRFYPEFRARLAKRPPMIFVGANDGMIHAFYAAPDLHWEDEEGVNGPRWQPGEEAWAYMPMSQLANGLVAVESGKTRFFSQDLSCRYTDVQVDIRFRTECTEQDQKDDPNCGWRTVLVCGQGWGGSWYVALDVTDVENPKPMWEFTHFPDANGQKALGRTWSLPAISLVPMHSAETNRMEPFWLATFGSGYNNTMKDCVTYKSSNQSCGSSTFKKSYRALNLPFDGDFPEHGQGTFEDRGAIYSLDVASGKIVRSFAGPAPGNKRGSPFLADGTVLDFNDDGFVDAAYMAQYNGMHRMNFDKYPTGMSMCQLSTSDNALTAHPTAFAYKAQPNASTFPVVLVSGAGIDSGRDPDQQKNQGNIWSVDSQLYEEKPGSTCPAGGYYCDLAPNWNKLNDGSRKARLLGAPLFSRQASGDDWILYTIWTAPHFNKICDTGEKATGNAHLLCMDVTLVPSESDPSRQVPRCEPCEGFKFGENTMIYENEVMPPVSPVSADGKVYVADPNKGLFVQDVVGSQGGPTPNSRPPTASIPTRMVSWREVF